MKKKIVLALSLLGSLGLYAQTGIGIELPHGTSVLDVTSTTKGMLIPRVDLTSDTDIVTIKGGEYPESLIVYHNGKNALFAGFYYWEKKKWNVLISNTNLYEYIKKEAKTDTVLITQDNGDYIFTWKDDKGATQTMKISEVIKKFESLTTLKGEAEGAEAVLTYKPERGAETKIPLTALLKKSTDFEAYIKSLITGNVVVPTTEVAKGTGINVVPTIAGTKTTYTVSAVPGEIDLTGDVGGKAGANTLNKIKNVNISTTPPSTTGQALVYNDVTKVWEPGKPAVNTGDITGKANLTTDGVIVVGDATTGTNSSPNSVLAATTLSIKTESITGDKIKASTLDGKHLKPATVEGNRIAPLTLLGGHIAEATITGGKIAPLTIMGGHIADATIGGGKITLDNITKDHIKDRAITIEKMNLSGPDRVLTTDAQGVPQWEPRADLGNLITANNGLTYSERNMQLGGALTKPTEITTTTTNTLSIKGLPSTGNAYNHSVLMVDGNGIVRKKRSAVPTYLYMPPISIDVVPNEKNKTIDFYNVYKQQFTVPVISTTGKGIDVFNVDELNYIVIYADSDVFTNLRLSQTGVLTYDVKPTAVQTGNTFITVVLQVKEGI